MDVGLIPRIFARLLHAVMGKPRKRLDPLAPEEIKKKIVENADVMIRLSRFLARASKATGNTDGEVMYRETTRQLKEGLKWMSD